MANYISEHTGSIIDNTINNALLKADAQALYLTQNNANATFLTKVDANNLYFKITDYHDPIVLLWTNPNPYADMAHNTKISIDLSQYQAVIIVFGEYMGDSWRRDSLTSHFCLKGQRHICNTLYMAGWTGTSTYNTARAVQIDDTGITLSQAVNSSSSYTNHTIPRFIYGVRLA